MPRIEMTTGKEWHTSYGAYGFVKVLAKGILKHHYSLNGCLTDWDEAEEIGNHGKHGKWIPSTIALPDGAIIYCEGADTYGGRPASKGRGWFMVDSSQDKITITTPGYSSRNLEVSGHLRQIGWREQEGIEGCLPIVRKSKWLEVK